MRNSSVIIACLLALVALAACGRDEGGGTPAGAVEASEWDSAGVRIVESAEEALRSLSWAVDTIPDLHLGEADGDGPSQFHGISGIVGLPDGGLVVLDGSSAELRWFGHSGEYIRSAGGQGQGPGEFGNPLLVPQFRPDSLLIFDRDRRSFTWVALDGSGVRTVGRAGSGVRPLFAGLPHAAVGSRVLFRSASSFGSCRENEHCEVPLSLRSVDLTGARSDTLAAYVGGMLLFREGSGPRLLVDSPFDQKGVVAAAPHGPVIEGDPRFELRQLDVEGRLIAIFRLDSANPGDPQDALDRMVEDLSDPDAARRLYRLMELPEVLPAFQALRVDHLGWYWAELFRMAEDGPSEWLVFDPEGRARGVIELPSGLGVHDIGEDHILGRWVDELGVEYVRRHALDRQGA